MIKFGCSKRTAEAVLFYESIFITIDIYSNSTSIKVLRYYYALIKMISNVSSSSTAAVVLNM